jgi:hypothetical protein
MTGPGRALSNSNVCHEVLAAWIVTLVAGAIGLLLVAFREPGADGDMAPKWHKPPVAGAVAGTTASRPAQP